MDETNWRFRIGAALGGMAGLAAFFAAWAYSAARFGLVGVSLGWLPAAAALALVAFTAFLLWDLAVKAASGVASKAEGMR